MFVYKVLLHLSILRYVVGTNINSNSTQYSEMNTTEPHGPLKNVMVTLPSVNGPILDYINYTSFPSREAQIDVLVSGLKNATETSQARIVQILKQNYLDFTTFWITNKILVKNVNYEIIRFLESLEGVESVDEEIILSVSDTSSKPVGISAFPEGGQPLWNIKKVRANEAWTTADGTGVTCAIIDTGVRGTHEALVDNYRGDNYGWKDVEKGTKSPVDIDGHGTHCLATAVGKGGVGVARGSKWIACRVAVSRFSFPQGALYLCAQWCLQPTDSNGQNPQSSMAPQVITNSWGNLIVGKMLYEDVIRAWTAARIFSVFAIGNRGSGCSTAEYPADKSNEKDIQSISVGSINQDDTMSFFSSRGPSRTGELCPQLVAYGADILSASIESDTSYVLDTGTSMATPHVAGAACILLSKKPSLTVAQVRKLLIQGASQNVRSPQEELKSCDINRLPTASLYPNNVAGYGICDVKSSLDKV